MTFDPKSVYLSVSGLYAGWASGYVGPTRAIDTIVPVASSHLFSIRQTVRVSDEKVTTDYYLFRYNIADLNSW